MKKITFTLVFIMSCCTLNLSAQQCDNTLPISENFDDSSVIGVCWNLMDQDGDGKNWYWREYGSSYGGYKCLTSRSWSSSSGNLNPDNWIYSYAVDLTSFNTNDDIYVSWKIRAENATFAHEYYTIYASTSNKISDFEASDVKLGEFADDIGAAGKFVTRNLDVSSLAGNMIYIAFRHQNIEGSQFLINIDDVVISNSLLSNDEFEPNSFKHFYNNTTKELTLKSDSNNLSNVVLYNTFGQEILSKDLFKSEETINLSSFNKGIYIAKIMIGETFKTIKILKQ
ncbi:choice-of-anchor J domain-containing protein [Flavisericum labens]|uniref:choice-of-anchor J domain-containing protein n=1 Tax=Flavisericum labens TaxID=3377112 RepID=UPI00387B7515